VFKELLLSRVKNDYVPNSIRLPNHRPPTVKKFRKILRECEKGKVISRTYREKNGIRKASITPLHPDKVAHTITTLPDDLLHYSEPRILTVRENARLQTFPDWFAFKGKYTTGGKKRRTECPRYTQVGNAVPPLLAEAIGKILLQVPRSK
ncbi:MAG: DNA cytosine methyltransferase, partial [Cyanobacteria bacterium J06555_13]